jgi:hypothetical protein
VGTPSCTFREVRDWEHRGPVGRRYHRREGEDMDSTADMPRHQPWGMAHPLAAVSRRQLEDAAVDRWASGTRSYSVVAVVVAFLPS